MSHPAAPRRPTPTRPAPPPSRPRPAAAATGAAGTRERLLDAAEELFASDGIAETSLRTLTRHAGVNLAAVHYHFGSKDGLVDAVVARLAGPLNADRRTALARIDGPPRPEAILAAYFVPVIERVEAPRPGGSRTPWVRLIARLESEPPETVSRLWRRHFGEVAQAFVSALACALPHLAPETVATRFRLALSAFTAVFASGPDVGAPAAAADRRSLSDRAHDAIAFAAAGLCAPERGGTSTGRHGTGDAR